MREQVSPIYFWEKRILSDYTVLALIHKWQYFACKYLVMILPETNYVVDAKGQKVFVQIALQDWEQLINEVKRLENLLDFKAKLKEAFREVRQIKRGEIQGISLSELIDEL